VRKNQPAVYVKILALLVPREMQVEHTNRIKQMTDEEIEQAIEAIQIMLAARAGEAAKVIEGTAEPAALPAPNGQSPEAALEPAPLPKSKHADTEVRPTERKPRKGKVARTDGGCIPTAVPTGALSIICRRGARPCR
jgi:hypothetical protein